MNKNKKMKQRVIGQQLMMVGFFRDTDANPSSKLSALSSYTDMPIDSVKQLYTTCRQLETPVLCDELAASYAKEYMADEADYTENKNFLAALYEGFGHLGIDNLLYGKKVNGSDEKITTFCMDYIGKNFPNNSEVIVLNDADTVEHAIEYFGKKYIEIITEQLDAGYDFDVVMCMLPYKISKENYKWLTKEAE